MEVTKRNKTMLPLAALLTCCLIWGTTFTAVKNTTNYIDPFLLSIFRNTLAAVVMLLYFWISGKMKMLKDIPSMKAGAVLGLLLGTIYVSQTIGIGFTSANHSAFITCSAVIIVPVILFFLGWEKFKAKQILSITAVSIGLALLTLKSGLSGFNLGDFITLLAAVICALHIVYSGYYVRKLNFLSLIFYQFLFAGLISSSGLLVKISLIDSSPILLTKSAIFYIFYLGLLGTLFCYFVTVWAQKHVTTIYIALLFSLEPIFASFTNYVVLDEMFNSKELIGAVVIFIGILMYSVPVSNLFKKRIKKPA